MIITAPTLSQPPARIHFLCQAHRKDASARGKDTKALQSSNKRLLVLIKTLSGLIAYWSWLGRIKDSFGKHMTGVSEGENNQYWCGFGLFKGQLKSKCSVPRLPVDGCVWPRWQFLRHTNISDEISVETRHPFPAAASSFASGWNPNPDIVRETEDGLMRFSLNWSWTANQNTTMADLTPDQLGAAHRTFYCIYRLYLHFSMHMWGI